MDQLLSGLLSFWRKRKDRLHLQNGQFKWYANFQTCRLVPISKIGGCRKYTKG